jgi:Fic family protein
MGQLQLLLEQANQALGRLDGFTSVLPDLSLFLYAYVRKEALLSSQIEGDPVLPFGSSSVREQ